MRNILQYPVTHGEAASALQDAQTEYYEKYKDNIGSISGIALLYAEMFIRENKTLFDEFTKKLPETNNE